MPTGIASSVSVIVPVGSTAPSSAAWKVLLVALFGTWAWLVACISGQWSANESYEYGWFVPFLAVALGWKRWQDAPQPHAATLRCTATAVLSVAALLLLPARWVHEANSLWRTISWPLGLAVTAMTAAVIYRVGGRPWLRHFAFPVLFFLVALPWPGSVENALMLPLKSLNTTVTAEALFLTGYPALQMGSTIELASGQVGVDDACSGIRSFHSSLMIALFLGELYRLRFSRRTCLVGGAVVVAFLFNIGRTLGLSMISAAKGPEVMARWHDTLGAFVAVACILALLVMARWLLSTTPACTPTAELRAVAPTYPLPDAFPMALSVSLIAWLAFVEVGTRVWYRVRESGMRTSQAWTLNWPTNNPGFQSNPVSGPVLRSYQADHAASGQWSLPNGSHWSAYYFKWGHGSPTAQLAKGHWPEVCLANSGKSLVGKPEVHLLKAAGLTLPFRTYSFDDQGTPLHVFHCIWEERGNAVSTTGLGFQPKLSSRIQSAWDGKRNLGQQLLEIAVWGFSEPAAAESALVDQLQSLITVE